MPGATRAWSRRRARHPPRLGPRWGSRCCKGGNSCLSTSPSPADKLLHDTPFTKLKIARVLSTRMQNAASYKAKPANTRPTPSFPFRWGLFVWQAVIRHSAGGSLFGWQPPAPLRQEGRHVVGWGDQRGRQRQRHLLPMVNAQAGDIQRSLHLPLRAPKVPAVRFDGESQPCRDAPLV